MLRRGWWLGGMAAGGVLLTHLATYFLLAPDAHARADLLDRSGHGSFAVVAAAALGFLAAATARFCQSSWQGHRLGAIAARLTAVQAVGWVALEAVERLAHGADHWDWRIFALGLVVQAVVGALIAMALRVVHRAIRILAGRSPRRFGPAAALAAFTPSRSQSLLRPALLAGAAGVRGPPSAR